MNTSIVHKVLLQLTVERVLNTQLTIKATKRREMKGLQVFGHFAQSVVEQFASVLDIPISITDNSGMIIGSTDNKRLGSHHILTAEIAESGKAMFFSKENTAGLVNVFPGIAAPLNFQEQTIGVLGLIGDPDTVERYLKFVQTHIEMLLVENFRSKTVNSQMEMLQGFVQHLLSHQENTDSKKIQKYSEMHGYSLKLLRRCILIDMPMTIDQNSTTQPLQAFTSTEQDLFLCLTNIFVKNEQDIVAPLNSGQWLIVTHIHSDDLISTKNILDYASDSLQTFLTRRSLNSDFKISSGDSFSTIAGLIQSYEQSRKALDIARRNNYKQTIVSINDWTLLSLALIEEIELPSKKALEYHIEKVRNHPNGQALIESFLVYCEEQLNMSQAARKLYIHRNTLLYRIQQLQQLLNINLQSFKQCTLLYLALKQHEQISK